MRHGLGVLALAGAFAAAGCNGASSDMMDRHISAYRAARAPDPPPAVAQVEPPPRRGGLFDLHKPLVFAEPAQAGQADYLGFAALTAVDPSAPSSRPTSQPNKGYVEWRQRRGPAYPDNFWTSFGRDGKEITFILLDDSRAAFTDPWTLAGLGLAGAAGITLAASDVDDSVAHHFTKHGSQLNTFWDSVGDAGGNPATHFAFVGAMYFTTLAAKDVKNYEVSKALLNALIITDLFSTGLKFAADTRSPNGDPWGWPSGHVSSSFALATVLGEAYGPWVGVPLFGFATYVGYERIDARNHDFSDVISGALIGIAIGHGVMQNHKVRIFGGFEVTPWSDPGQNAVGVGLVKKF